MVMRARCVSPPAALQREPTDEEEDERGARRRASSADAPSRLLPTSVPRSSAASPDPHGTGRSAAGRRTAPPLPREVLPVAHLDEAPAVLEDAVRSSASGDYGGEPESPSGRGRMHNYEATFRHMTHRRLQRELLGVYSKPHPGRDALWIMLFVVLQVGLASVSFTNGVSVKIDVTSNLLALLLNMLFLYVALSTVVSMFRWAIFCLAAGSAIMVIVSGDVTRARRSNPRRSNPLAHSARAAATSAARHATRISPHATRARRCVP